MRGDMRDVSRLSYTPTASTALALSCARHGNVTHRGRIVYHAPPCARAIFKKSPRCPFTIHTGEFIVSPLSRTASRPPLIKGENIRRLIGSSATRGLNYPLKMNANATEEISHLAARRYPVSPARPFCRSHFANRLASGDVKATSHRDSLQGAARTTLSSEPSCEPFHCYLTSNNSRARMAFGHLAAPRAESFATAVVATRRGRRALTKTRKFAESL